MATDIFDEADNAVERVPEYATWGQASANFYEAYWPKGSSSPIAFDPNSHPRDKRFIMAEIIIIPLDEMQARYNTEFKQSTDRRDWAGVTLPSIKALGISARNIDGGWFKVVKKPNGKTYPKKDRTTGELTGEIGQLTDFLFLKVFAGHDECLADYLAETSGEPVSDQSAADFPAGNPVVQPTTQAPAPGSAILLKFAEAIIKTSIAQVGKDDLVKLSEHVALQINANKAFDGHYTGESKEIQDLILAAIS